MDRVYYVLLIMLFVPQLAMAQQDSLRTFDETTETRDEKVEISIGDLTKLHDYKVRYLDIKYKYDSLESKYSSLYNTYKKNTDELDGLRLQRSTRDSCIQSLEKSLETVNKQLVNMAANFLCIPYEAYGVDSIALYAFEAITDKNLQLKHRVRHELLRRYKTHVEEVKNFLVEQEKVLKDLAGRNEEQSVLAKMKQEDFYNAYQRLGAGMKYTYLGEIIIEIEKQLQDFDGSIHRLNVKDIIAGLDACLKTQE